MHPKNKQAIKSQEKKLLSYLQTGKKINCTSPIKNKLGIGYLNSRIASLSKDGHVIERKFITLKRADGSPMAVKQYWMKKAV